LQQQPLGFDSHIQKTQRLFEFEGIGRHVSDYRLRMMT
jgi:hypothetical protein